MLRFRACTSIVAEDAAGNIIHGRNLDYELLPDLLRNITVEVDFLKNGKVTEHDGVRLRCWGR